MKLGFIGIGAMARHHARAALELGAEIYTAVSNHKNSSNWDKFRETLKAGGQDRSVIRYSDDARDGMLTNASVDAIVAAPSWQVMSDPQFVRKLLNCKKPVLMEKPIALREPMGIITGPHGKMVGFNRRFYETAWRLRSRIRGKDLRSVDVRISEHTQHHIATTGEDVLPHLFHFTSVHMINLLHWFFPVIDVEHIHRTASTRPELQDVQAMLHSRLVPIHLSMMHDDPDYVGIFCSFTDGTVWALSPLETLRVYKGVEIDESGIVRKFKPKLVHQWVVDEQHGKPGIYEQMKAFLGGDYYLGTTFNEALEDVRLLDTLVGNEPPATRFEKESTDAQSSQEYVTDDVELDNERIIDDTLGTDEDISNQA